MPDLGNAWHIPGSPEPRGVAGMLDPVGAIVAGTRVTVVTGNQFQGPGNPGNQLQVGSALFVRRAVDPSWTTLPLAFLRTVANNKYFSASLPTAAFQTGDVVQYYLRIAYDDHDTTFLHAAAGGSVTTADENAARAAPFRFPVADSAQHGRWAPVFGLPNAAVHASVLPDGRVLIWGRRDRPTDSLDVHECTPFVWNPVNGAVTDTPQPRDTNGAKVNLFCAGHAFLADGRLLVVGGHLADSDGLSLATLYDWRTDTWTPTAPMTTPAGAEVRRWYPTATTLPNGQVLVLSGSYLDPTRPPGSQIVVVDLLQVWDNGAWKTIKQADGTPLTFVGLPLYPRMHVAADGRVFMSGTNDRTLLLKTSQPGAWTEVGLRALGNRDYCPAVMYDRDKVIYIGGGNDAGTMQPTAQVEVIDLAAAPRRWRATNPMTFRRRQHNAVILPDGTVLVTGGTRGGGGPDNGFNDLAPGQPVHVAELWDPATEEWTELAAESVDRCYHATAVLLPDATVLSAGGGEYRPVDENPNDPQDTHRDAQVFHPPYLCTGDPRPTITSAPGSVGYGQTFDVDTPTPDAIGRVSWIRLPSVTHSLDQNQRINFLTFETRPGGLRVTAPASPNACPPGHHMLFLISTNGVPSVSAIMRIGATGRDLDAAPERSATPERSTEPESYSQIEAIEAELAGGGLGPAVVVGLTGTCPYGIGACWGGAYAALGRLDGVARVGPVPNTRDSTAEVFLVDDRLPDLDAWGEQFRRVVNGSYELRGVEMRLDGVVETAGGEARLVRGPHRSAVRLRPLRGVDKIQWDQRTRSPRVVTEEEAAAYDRLLATGQGRRVTVTGPLRRTATGYVLHVRDVGG